MPTRSSSIRDHEHFVARKRDGFKRLFVGSDQVSIVRNQIDEWFLETAGCVNVVVRLIEEDPRMLLLVRRVRDRRIEGRVGLLGRD